MPNDDPVLAMMQSTREWVHDLPEQLQQKLWHQWLDWADLSGVVDEARYHRLEGSATERRAACDDWRARNWRMYPHLLTEPVRGVCHDDWRLAAEWMAYTSKLPLLLCDIYCCYWHDENVLTGLLRRPREFGALELKRRFLVPGSLNALLSWLTREGLLQSVPASWMAALPLAPTPSSGKWTSCSFWQSGSFDVETAVVGFDGPDEAERFGSAPSLLQFLAGELIIAPSALAPLRLADSNVKVCERRDNALQEVGGRPLELGALRARGDGVRLVCRAVGQPRVVRVSNGGGR